MTDEETLSVYAAKAGEYAQVVTRHKPDRDLRAFIDLMPEGAKVLDWGCGPGNSAAMLGAVGLQVTATDACPEMVTLAKARFDISADLASFDDMTAQAAFDGIYANFSLLHAPKSDFPRHLAQAAAALKPGGYMHLGLKRGRGEHRDRLGRFYAYYELDELAALLQEAGLVPLTHRLGETQGLAGTTDPFLILIAQKPDA